MSVPTQPIGTARSEDVRAYIGAVRAWLDDLPAEDVDDLTLGMEADLSERAAEGDVRLGDLLGDPEQYAAELRAAAGLPPRVPRVGAVSSDWAGSVAVSTREAGERLVGSHPWLRDLRPTWWVLRGLALGWLLVVLPGAGPSAWVVALLGVIPSVWWGRRCRDGRVRDGAAVATLVVNAIAALAAVALSLVLLSSASSGTVVTDDAYLPPGVTLGGSPVSDLYVYDAQGNRVEGARILTETGQRLFVDTSGYVSEDVPLRPDGSPDIASDVFPLVVGDRDPWADPETGWTPPLTLPPLPVVPSPDASTPATATPTPSSSPSSTSAPSPSPTLTPSGSPAP